jgi:hypothetical protein
MPHGPGKCSAGFRSLAALMAQELVLSIDKKNNSGTTSARFKTSPTFRIRNQEVIFSSLPSVLAAAKHYFLGDCLHSFACGK